jgi:peptidoglycan/xylan/chitin deacetylase (PgdA/CDA1 family)
MLKRITNLVVSLCVRTLDALGNACRRLVGLSPRCTCVVLAYHAVTPEQRAQFSHQMDTLTKRAKPIRADIERLPKEGGQYVAVTFDDGLESVVENALPELKKRHIPATLFIVTEVLGGFPRWQNMGGADASQEKAMSEQQLQQLPSELVTIGSHSMNHSFLPSVDKDQLRLELVGSRIKLEKMLNRGVRLFSFPYGAFNANVLESCREAGYERVFTALPVLAFAEPQEFVTGRVGVNATDWPIEFRLKLAGAYRWLPKAFAWKRSILSVVRKAATERVGLEQGEKMA